MGQFVSSNQSWASDGCGCEPACNTLNKVPQHSESRACYSQDYDTLHHYNSVHMVSNIVTSVDQWCNISTFWSQKKAWGRNLTEGIYELQGTMFLHCIGVVLGVSEVWVGGVTYIVTATLPWGSWQPASDEVSRSALNPCAVLLLSSTHHVSHATHVRHCTQWYNAHQALASDEVSKRDHVTHCTVDTTHLVYTLYIVQCTQCAHCTMHDVLHSTPGTRIWWSERDSASSTCLVYKH